MGKLSLPDPEIYLHYSGHQGTDRAEFFPLWHQGKNQAETRKNKDRTERDDQDDSDGTNRARAALEKGDHDVPHGCDRNDQVRQ